MILNNDILIGVRTGTIDGYCNTGRTSRMIDEAKDGDIIIVHSYRFLSSVKRLCKKKNKSLKILVVNPTLEDIQRKLAGRDKSKVHIDHYWLQQYYYNMMDRAHIELQQTLS